MRICAALSADSDPLTGIAGQCGGRSLERMVLPDRIELFRSSLSSLKDQEFFKPLTLVVYQRKDHL
jgi:hypothetical protein